MPKNDDLDESESLLTGKKLVPFWRSTTVEVVAGTAQGLNLQRVFNHPRRFDLVLPVQGTDAVPYLEPGELSDQRVIHFLSDSIDLALYRNLSTCGGRQAFGHGGRKLATRS